MFDPNIDNHIQGYLHCKMCTDDLPAGISPSDYQNIQMGFVHNGEAVQVWCNNHDVNVGVFELKEPLNVGHCDCC